MGGKIHKLAEGIGGLGFGAGFQVLSYGNQCEGSCAGFEIEFMGILMDDVHIAVSEAIGHFIHGKYRRIGGGGSGTDCHQGSPYWGPFYQGFEAGLIEMAVDDHNGDGRSKSWVRADIRVFSIAV